MTRSRPNLTSWFAGAEPFPHLDDWRADAALFAHQSLLGLVEAGRCDPLTLESLVRLPQEEWEQTLLHPSSFAFIAGAGESHSWHSGRDATTLPLACVDRPGVLADAPAPEFAQLLQNLGSGSRRSSCDGARYLRSSDFSFSTYVAAIEDAVRFLVAERQGFADELRQTVQWIGLVDGAASFRGASGVIQRGLLLFSPDATWTWETFAEELVHEVTHTVLDLVSLREPLLTGERAFVAEHTAPFRPDPRPLFGNFHAVVVVARLACLFEALGAADQSAAEGWRRRAVDYVASAEQPLTTVMAYDGLSDLARTLLFDYTIPVFEAVLGRPVSDSAE